jgi:hypothetical protein
MSLDGPVRKWQGLPLFAHAQFWCTIGTQQNTLSCTTTMHPRSLIVLLVGSLGMWVSEARHGAHSQVWFHTSKHATRGQ